MASTSTSTEREIDMLGTTLTEMAKQLRFFSLSMRALYAEENVGSSTDAARRFTALRNAMTNDAKLYLKVFIPLTMTFVSSIKDFFDYYEYLSYEKWREMLKTIIERVKDQKDLAETLRQMHQSIMGPLKKSEREAKLIMAEFKNLQSEFEKKTQEFESKAGIRYKGAYYLAFFPVVNVIACPLLRLSAKEYTAKAIAKTAESKTHEAAAVLVAETLIPALSYFIEGLEKAAAFFQLMEEELRSLINRGEQSSAGDFAENHYLMMKGKVKNINPSASQFFITLPAVRSDFDSLPADEAANQNYIEKWLEEKLVEIAEKRISTRKAIWNVVSGIKGIVLRPILPELSAPANNE